MAFADEGFNPNNQSYTFAFNILKKSGDMFIGVGNNENLKSYILDDNPSLGHGQYMICNTTFLAFQKSKTLHHTDQRINNKENGYIFKTGDMIQIK